VCGSQVPGLAVVIVGSRKDSQTYVNMKRKACAEVGIRSVDVDLPEDISEVALVAEVHRLNADPNVHGTASLPLSGQKKNHTAQWSPLVLISCV
jgi:5,10-methylene-tetrahydrofolate dehydrogenase/methenyl tetrahydrofolate cyclohydrolase